MLGDRLGKWVIFKELGRGGMGRVYLAQEEIGGRQAALKILAAELAQDVGFLERFQREIDTLSRLDHPGIVRFYEAGYENDCYFYAMEYVDGQSLEKVLEDQGRLHWRDVLDLAMQVCPALRHVHDHGIIHRDLKPANLIRTSAGVVKLTDFGIAKIFAAGHLTATGGVVGTAEFLSPEQAAGKPVSKRSDLYSLGAVLYTLLTGRPPFEGEGFLDLLHKQRYGQFDRPHKRVPDLPYEIDELVCLLLEKDPAKRPPDCLVLGKQIEAIRRRLDRKQQQTGTGGALESTVAENRPGEIGLPGPGTLMSRLMRAELEEMNRPGWLGRLFNRAWVLALCLGLCLGVIVWTFWPASAEYLYTQGAQLMASDRAVDWNLAFRDYLDPLEERFPDHPYKEKVQEFRKKVEAARSPVPSEAQRFYHQGEKLFKEGNYLEARRVWNSVVTAFSAVEAEKNWVAQARKALDQLEKTASAPERWQVAREALKRAAALRDQGQRAEAEKIWTALRELYRNDPWATEILQEIDRAEEGK